jgi:hypothetical protein
MASPSEIAAQLDALEKHVHTLTDHARSRLLAEREFLLSVRSGYEASSGATKDAEVAKALVDIQNFLSAG